MKSFRLTKNSAGDYDLLMQAGTVPIIEDGAQVAQHAMQRVLIFKGEPSLDGFLTTKTEDGTQWYEILLATDVAKIEKEFHLKKRILQTPGIKKILSMTLNVVDHVLTINGRFQTDWGTETMSEDVTLL